MTGNVAMLEVEPSAHTGAYPIAFAARQVSTPSPTDGAAARDAEHAAVDLRPALRLIEPHADDAGDRIVVYRSEGGDQGRDEDRCAGVLIAPRTAKLKAQHATGNIFGQDQCSRSEICLDRRIFRLAGIGPNCFRVPDALKFIIGKRTPLGFSVSDAAVELFDAVVWNIPVTPIARLPLWHFKHLPDISLTIPPVVAAMRKDNEALAIRPRLYCHRAVARTVVGAGGQDLPADNVAAERGPQYAKINHWPGLHSSAPGFLFYACTGTFFFFSGFGSAAFSSLIGKLAM